MADRVVVLDRGAGGTGIGEALERTGDTRGVRGEPVLGIDVHRHIDRGDDRAHVGEQLVEIYVLVGLPSDAAWPELVVASAGKPKAARIRRTDIPLIRWHDEHFRFAMQFGELSAASPALSWA